MKKSIILLIIGIFLVLVSIVSVVIFKFVLNPLDSFNIDELEKIIITDLNNSGEKLENFLDKNGSTYLLFFQLNDCYSCVYKGLEELKHLKKAGKISLAVVVDEYLTEVKTWSAAHDFPDCLMLKRIDFYEYIKCPATPVLVKIKKGKVDNYKYILSN